YRGILFNITGDPFWSPVFLSSSSRLHPPHDISGHLVKQVLRSVCDGQRLTVFAGRLKVQVTDPGWP
ncbi:hypothetical protein, partial [Deinococcus radiotolerans]|uniref:hypothetical protein n=1 Tax=Deinococcus radiotolerans TaxID=1309407 RepID=UPI001E3CF202